MTQLTYRIIKHSGKIKKRYRKKSGGIMVLFRKTMLKCITIIESNSNKDAVPTKHLENYRFVNYNIPEHCIFFEICLENKKHLFCNTYLPPENSKYAIRTGLVDIQESLINFDYDNVVVLGDLNARVGRNIDYIDDVDDETNLTMPDVMQTLGIQKDRASKDNVTNNFGTQLIDFCKSQNMLILNGRVGSDALTGKLTCKDASTVDYVIASPSFFPLISDFKVIDFDESMSDVHCPLLFSIKLQHNQLSEQEKEEVPIDQHTVHKTFWKPELTAQFIDNLDDNMIREVSEKLNDLYQNIDNVEQTDIDDITKAVTKIMQSSAERIGIVKSIPLGGKKKAISKAVKMPWFDAECRMKRRIFRKAQRKHKKKKNDEHLKEQRRAEYKAYNKLVKQKSNRYRRDIQKKLRKMKTTDRSKYWKIINEAINDLDNNETPNVDDLIKHFEKLGMKPDSDIFASNEQEINLPNINNDMLNNDITKEEILKATRKLKSNKASGYDGVLNEFLKSGSEKLVKLFVLLFNMVLKRGVIPDVWAVGVISPIYKGKGNRKMSDNYRGITILSCFGKLFTSILNERINIFLNDNDLLGVEQSGFRAGHSCIDQVYALHSLIDLYLKNKKRLYCTFIDYKKAFDNVQRNLLWDKLLQSGISGNVLKVIKNMYSKAKSCIKVQQINRNQHINSNKITSDFFINNIGVRQGENLSPILFSLFINDLKDFLSNYMKGTELPKTCAEMLNFQDVESFVNLFLLLYADDTVILSETDKDMQKGLDALSEYCTRNGLEINVSKTKIIVFSRGKIRNLPIFTYNNANVEIVFDYKYLGVIFNYNNRFQKAMKNQCNSATRAMFSLLKKSRKLDLPLDLQLDLYQKCIKPILLYGCEMWGFENTEMLEKIQLKYLKMLLGVKASTPSCMIYGELGVYPLKVDIQLRMLTYWYKLCKDFLNGMNKLSVLMFRFNNALHRIDNNQWLLAVHNILDNLGLGYIHQNALQQNYSIESFKSLVKKRLTDQYQQSWKEEIDRNNICITYRLIKTEFCFEKYLINLYHLARRNLLKFRLSSHRLPIQHLRYTDIPRHDRLCTLCDMNELGDEFHYLFSCKHQEIFRNRKTLLSKYFQNNPNVIKLHHLFNTTSKKKLIKLCKFISIIFSHAQ